jgi:hypothetical protein
MDARLTSGCVLAIERARAAMVVGLSRLGSQVSRGVRRQAQNTHSAFTVKVEKDPSDPCRPSSRHHHRHHCHHHRRHRRHSHCDSFKALAGDVLLAAVVSAILDGVRDQLLKRTSTSASLTCDGNSAPSTRA